MERNFLLKIEYDGSGFSGWQRQPEARTVQGELEAAQAEARRAQRHREMFSCLDAGEQAQLLALLEKLNRDWQSRFRDGREGRRAGR